jgi:predicted phage terminase large subunit-like protein
MRFNQYIKEKPFAKQLAYMLLPHQEALYGGRAGGGKLLWIYHKLNTPVWYTDAGVPSYQPIEGGVMAIEARLLKDIQVGDYVLDQDGKPTQVLAKSPICKEPTYKITMVDGEEIICGERHLWNVATYRDRMSYLHTHPEWRAKRRSKRPSRAVASPMRPKLSTILTKNNKERVIKRDQERNPLNIWDYTQTIDTKTLSELVVTETRKVGIPVAGAFTGGDPWPQTMLSPYYLGVWLGDGTACSGDLTQDPTVFEDGSSDATTLTGFLAQDGIRLEPTKSPKSFKVFMPDGSRPQKTLREFGLLHNKHIPEFVFTADYDSRLRVLQGIVDTDGHIDTRGSLEICFTDDILIKDVRRLLGTLGIHVNISVSEAAYTKNGVRKVTGNRYRIKCVPTIPVARFPRKLNRLQSQNRTDNRHLYRYIKSVVLLEETPDLQCIQVANPRGLFCVEDSNLVTHNSSALLSIALGYVHIPGYSCIIFRRTLTDLKQPGALLSRAHEWLKGTDARWAGDEHIYYFPTRGPDGEPAEPAKIAFGYMGESNIRNRYKSAEYQCVEKGTLVLMGDGTYSPIEQIKVGQKVATLFGPRKVTRTFGPLYKECVHFGGQIQSVDHRVLSSKGTWSGLPKLYEPTQCCVFDKSAVLGSWKVQNASTSPYIPKQRQSRLDNSFWLHHPYDLSSHSLLSITPSIRSLQATPVGIREVYDITVDEDNHFITATGIINRNCLIWDELTEFDIEDYLFMFSRLRAKACPIHKTGDDGKPAWDDKCGWCSLYRQLPLKVRSATNPGSVGHAWVKDRFRITPADPNVREWEIPNDATEVEWVGKHPDRPFLQADYRDNPFIIQEDYAKSLDNLPPLERARFKYGNWAANFDARFDRRWARYYSTLGDYFVLGRDSVGDSFHWKDLKRVFGTVDPATSLKEGLSEKAVYNRDPSRTVISIWGLTENNDLLWLDIDYFQEEAPVVVERMKRMYQKWRPVYFKMETNGPGKPIAQYASLAGIPITMNKKYRDKVSNSITAQVKMKAGKIWLPQTAPWLKDVEDEVFNWIGSPSQKDDIVDTLSDAANDVLWESGDETATYMQDGMQVATEAPIYVPL